MQVGIKDALRNCKTSLQGSNNLNTKRLNLHQLKVTGAAS
jgi:hypothetical protein